MEPLVRYSVPTRYDLAPRCTICKVMGDGPSYKLYVQIGEVSDAATWISMGDLLEQTLKDLILDQDFVNDCVTMNQDNTGCPSMTTWISLKKKSL